MLIEHPFVHPRTVNKEFSPLERPDTYRQEFLKSVVLFTAIVPLIQQGLVILFPDPCNFDFHLRDQMLQMARFRSREMKANSKEEAGLQEILKEDQKRSLLLLPREALRRHVLRASPELDEKTVEVVLDGFDTLRERDSLAVLQEGSLEGGEGGGQFTSFKMAPNLEITMYLAQATGSCIVTDSVFRWRELLAAAGRGIQGAPPLVQLRASMERAEFILPNDAPEIVVLAERGIFRGYAPLMRKVFKSLSSNSIKGPKPNFEASLNAEFLRVHASAVAAIKRSGARFSEAKISCLFPLGGIQDNTVNRLLLMSSSEHHLGSAPMALFVKTNTGRNPPTTSFIM